MNDEVCKINRSINHSISVHDLAKTKTCSHLKSFYQIIFFSGVTFGTKREGQKIK